MPEPYTLNPKPFLLGILEGSRMRAQGLLLGNDLGFRIQGLGFREVVVLI